MLDLRPKLEEDKATYVVRILKTTINHYIPKWSYHFTKSKTIAGSCNFTKSRIEISNHYIFSETITHKDIKNTILHEIAHALTYGHNHDKVWKEKCIEIGGKGNIYCEKVFKKPTYVYGCGDGCEIPRYRKSKYGNGHYTCRLHQKKIKLLKKN